VRPVAAMAANPRIARPPYLPRRTAQAQTVGAGRPKRPCGGDRAPGLQRPSEREHERYP